MKVLIVRQPTGSLEGLSLRAYHLGEVYDIAPSVAEYLVAEGFAIVEMRKLERGLLPLRTVGASGDKDRRDLARAAVSSKRKEGG